MTMLPLDVTAIWAFLLAFMVFAYVALDGFDLGLGMLFGIFPAKRDRDTMMNSVAPVWDGNETWLVMGGGALFAAFPLGYALVLSALYVPIILMLLSLVFRGVAFEFRWRAKENRRKLWDFAFMAGSGLATFMQGAVLGALLQGIRFDETEHVFTGSWIDWLTPFSVLTGVALMAGYSLLGATWLVLKTEGDLQRRARRLALWFGALTVGFIGAVSLATPFLQDGYYTRWFTGWGLPAAFAVGAGVLVLAGLLWRALNDPERHRLPFILSLSLFGLSFIGLGVCMWPFIIPTDLTIWEAAAPRSSQIFMLVGAAILIPIILGYTGYTYWVFRGKVDPDAGYH